MGVRVSTVVGSALSCVLLAGCGGAPQPLVQVGSTVVSVPTAVAVPAAVTPSGVAVWAQGQGASGVPVRAVQAYGEAELLLRRTEPGCHLSWTTLAGIGTVESANGTFGGAVLGADGVSSRLVRGLDLDGTGDVAAIGDSDGGVLDGVDGVDRAVGPMQFIPDTWARWATDGDGDGVRSPDDLDDAAAAAGRYLCSAGGDLATDAGWTAAVFAYNHSDAYVAQVHAAAVVAAR